MKKATRKSLFIVIPLGSLTSLRSFSSSLRCRDHLWSLRPLRSSVRDPAGIFCDSSGILVPDARLDMKFRFNAGFVAFCAALGRGSYPLVQLPLPLYFAL